MNLQLNGKRAAVAASSAGLGFAVANSLAAEGARVVLNGRDADKLDSAVQKLDGAGTGIVLDVSTESDARVFVEQAIEQLGGLDILIINGGGPPPGNFASTPPNAYRAAIEQNCLAGIAMCGAAVPIMQKQSWGRIVAITSLAVRQPMENLILSNVARTGLTAFLKTLAREIAGDGITVNSLQPGGHATARIAQLHESDLQSIAAGVLVGRLGEPDDFGAIATFLCSPQAEFITGAAIPVDGGAYVGLQ